MIVEEQMEMLGREGGGKAAVKEKGKAWRFLMKLLVTGWVVYWLRCGAAVCVGPTPSPQEHGVSRAPLRSQRDQKWYWKYGRRQLYWRRGEVHSQKKGGQKGKGWERRESEKEVGQKGKCTEEMGCEGKEEKKNEEDNAEMEKSLVEARTCCC